jgi:predicted CopG family antitoxin
MVSKNISITEEVYNKLIKIKSEDESFSELFLRLLNSLKMNIEDVFGTWDLTEKEKREIWDDIAKREGRKWQVSNFERK